MAEPTDKGGEPFSVFKDGRNVVYSARSLARPEGLRDVGESGSFSALLTHSSLLEIPSRSTG